MRGVGRICSWRVGYPVGLRWFDTSGLEVANAAFRTVDRLNCGQVLEGSGVISYCQPEYKLGITICFGASIVGVLIYTL